ncbi:triose-phosphate isomerase family protein [Enterococcus xiangfangensis]|uniref:Triosephosphate isomerase n=1 Tax=Enterococcus xiangfangensis TaxID=1296537 RepID=A0ABU3FB70_9ENTE|nr:triose-phosphate isomerase family protein [Enterococcus xiangfangensis]MDT2759912.1 triose-phosphate isomerase [Enterococcus xiangfangensis]
MNKPLVGMSLKNYINSPVESRKLSVEIVELTKYLIETTKVDIFLLPSIGTLESVSKVLENSKIKFGAQNIAPYKVGPYTGEYSIESLIELNGKYVEIGHHERRTIFHEENAMIKKKLILALENGLYPILCIGESETNLSDNELKSILNDQIISVIPEIDMLESERIILAYEPGWAIGKQQPASTKHVHRVHELINQVLINQFGLDIASNIRIIYGGSVSKDSVKDIVNNKFVAGVFVGRFGHNPTDFLDIIKKVIEIKEG